MEVAVLEKVKESDPGQSKQNEAKKASSKYTDETHPYTTPEFWLNPKNQFWNRSSMYKKEKYEHILVQCAKELKENLIN